MARINARNENSILKINAFLGLNENPDGDTTIKVGEMSEMRNFRITRDHHMQIRPGSKTIMDLSVALAGAGGDSTAGTDNARLYGVWHGLVGGREVTLAAYAGTIWEIDVKKNTYTSRGTAFEAGTSFFGFNGKVYLLNGHEYMSWDGGIETQFQEVEGYIPLVQTATSPAGAGTLVERVNRLSKYRRVEFSPDGTAQVFQLPEKDIYVSTVKLNGILTNEYTSVPANGTIRMNTVPEAGVNTMEVVYLRDSDSARSEVTGMRYAELFNGQTDSRIFLYGDGTNRAIYSGIELDTGIPSAEYFPDLSEVAVGESNTPITALVRHYSRMLAFKANSTWVVQHATITLPNGVSTTAFYVQPVNRQIGNDALGQVKLIENNPLSIDVGSIYQWESKVYSGYSAGTESNAKRISDRVALTLRTFDIKKVKTFNIKYNHEFWFIYNRRAIILNYANNTWYVYEDLPFDAVMEIEQEVYGFGGDGKIVEFSRKYRNDDGRDLVCYAATGAMDFGKDWILKYSPMIFVAMQPETGARLTVTVETNRRSDYPDKLVAYSLATFFHIDFWHFSFGTNRKPQVERVKMKVKKATFYKLIFKSKSASATATLIEADVKLRYAGMVK